MVAKVLFYDLLQVFEGLFDKTVFVLKGSVVLKKQTCIAICFDELDTLGLLKKGKQFVAIQLKKWNSL